MVIWYASQPPVAEATDISHLLPLEGAVAVVENILAGAPKPVGRANVKVLRHLCACRLTEGRWVGRWGCKLSCRVANSCNTPRHTRTQRARAHFMLSALTLATSPPLRVR